MLCSRATISAAEMVVLQSCLCCTTTEHAKLWFLHLSKLPHVVEEKITHLYHTYLCNVHSE